MSDAKISVSKKAIGHIEKKLTKDMVLGIGTGSTVNFFISELAKYKDHFYGAVSSSEASTKLLQEIGIEVFSLNDINEVAYYIDGADEVSPENYLIKGGDWFMPKFRPKTLFWGVLCTERYEWS